MKIELSTGAVSINEIGDGELNRKGDQKPGFGQLRDAQVFAEAVLTVRMKDGSERISYGEDATNDAEILRRAGVSVA